MRPFYINGMMRALVLSLVGIFTPIYIYKSVGWEWVFGYYILMRITVLICAIPISHLIEKIGFRRSITVSLLFLIISYGVLLKVGQNEWWLVTAAIASGLNVPFYWIARNSAISQDESRARVGKQMGIMTSVEAVATMMGPLTAGLIIERFGFGMLYTVALLILIFSVLPLWGMRPHIHRNGVSVRGFVYWVTSRRYFHNGVGIGARAVDDYAINVLWPLAIFGLGIRSGILGGIFSFVALISLAVRLTISRVFDKLRRRNDYSDEWVYGISASVSSILWILRLFAKSVGGIVGIDAIGAVFGTSYASMYVDYEQLGGKRMGSMAYWVYGEMMYSIMAIGLFGITGIGAYFGIWKETFMILASFWVLVSIVMARESNMK